MDGLVSFQEDLQWLPMAGGSTPGTIAGSLLAPAPEPPPPPATSDAAALLTQEECASLH